MYHLGVMDGLLIMNKESPHPSEGVVVLTYLPQARANVLLLFLTQRLGPNVEVRNEWLRPCVDRKGVPIDCPEDEQDGDDSLFRRSGPIAGDAGDEGIIFYRVHPPEGVQFHVQISMVHATDGTVRIYGDVSPGELACVVIYNVSRRSAFLIFPIGPPS